MVVPLFGHQNYFWAVTGDRADLAIDKERSTRKKAVKKYEELGGIYAFRLKDGRRVKPSKGNIGYCEIDFHDSRMVNSVYDLIMLEKLSRLPDSLLKDLLSEE